MRSVDHDREIAGDENRPVQSFDDLPRKEWLELFSSIATGDEAALDRIFELSARTLYGLALWRTASVEDARDVVQDVFVRVAERRRDLPAVRDPRSWLLAVTHRLAIDFTRRRKVRRTSALDGTALLSAVADGTERSMDQSLATRSNRVLVLLAATSLAVLAVILIVQLADRTAASERLTPPVGVVA